MGAFLSILANWFNRAEKRNSEAKTDGEARYNAAMAAQQRVEKLQRAREESGTQETVPNRPKSTPQAPYKRRSSPLLQWTVGR
ncbi:hypothetical protein SUGI_0725150 [Cryptomeria japonica]|nr:hypothetical protein SUGI_0725150 [Cryptomeria japonica]